MKMRVAQGLVIVAVAVLGMAAAAGGAQAAGPGPWGANRTVEGGRQIVSEDFTVEEGQVVDEDVTVWSGDVEVKEGGRIAGNLFVFSGDIEIGQGAEVTGDVTTNSGDVEVAGNVGGSVASLSGNIQLDASAVVQGDVSVVSGNLSRDEGAVVRGNVAEGPQFRFPGAPTTPRTPNALKFETERPSFFAGVLAFFGRILAALILTLLATALVVGLFYVRPRVIADTRTIVRHQTALSGVVGVLVNLTLLFLVGVLTITICLSPLALVPLLALIALNTVGWAVASQVVGERLVQWANQPVQESLKLAVGAVVLTGLVTLLWALGGCGGFLAFLVALVVGSLGTGAFLLPWINRRHDGSAPVSGGPTPEPKAPSGGSGGTGTTWPGVYTPAAPPAEPVETDVAAPLDYVTAAEINAAQPAPRAVPPSTGEPTPRQAAGAEDNVETDAAAPLDYLTAEEVNAGNEPRPAQHAVTPEHADRAPAAAAAGGEPEVELDAAAPVDYRTAQEINAAEEAGDDFTKIRGIGPAYARRLKQAGLTTYAQLAAAAPAQIAAVLGWPAERVVSSEVVDQAKVLAARS